MSLSILLIILKINQLVDSNVKRQGWHSPHWSPLLPRLLYAQIYRHTKMYPTTNSERLCRHRTQHFQFEKHEDDMKLGAMEALN